VNGIGLTEKIHLTHVALRVEAKHAEGHFVLCVMSLVVPRLELKEGKS
jgi:hypothetical protein